MTSRDFPQVSFSIPSVPNSSGIPSIRILIGDRTFYSVIREREGKTSLLGDAKSFFQLIPASSISFTRGV